MSDRISPESRSRLGNFGLVAGPLLALIVAMLMRQAGVSVEASTAAAVVTLMATWWMSEAIPLAVTALLPLILCPILPIYPDSPLRGQTVVVSESLSLAEGELTGQYSAKVKQIDGVQATIETVSGDGDAMEISVPLRQIESPDKRKPFQRAAEPFANRFIFLFLGGFVIALSIERWNLHRRIALLTLQFFGTSPRMIIAGFMCTTAGLSMWISNTATTVMMLPIAMSVIGQLLDQQKRQGKPRTETGESVTPTTSDEQRFATCLMLAIAYAASVGGIATLVGTPPNALLASFLSDKGHPVSFGTWMIFALPISLVLLVLIWVILTQAVFRFRLEPISSGRSFVKDELRRLGRMNHGEIATLVVFLLTATCWVTRAPLSRWEWFTDTFPLILNVDDSIIALIGAISLFFIPVSLRPIKMTMDWEHAKRLPWGILLLFGGGLSLAGVVQDSGLGITIGDWIKSNSMLSAVGLMVLTTVVVVFLTEFTSNMATTSLFLPILFEVSLAVTDQGGNPLDPEYLLVPATLAASCAFMLPVATPPNAIVFASERVTIPQMARAGICLNIVAVAILPFLVILLAPILF